MVGLIIIFTALLCNKIYSTGLGKELASKIEYFTSSVLYFFWGGGLSLALIFIQKAE